jgi:hypothetical protein
MIWSRSVFSSLMAHLGRVGRHCSFALAFPRQLELSVQQFNSDYRSGSLTSGLACMGWGGCGTNSAQAPRGIVRRIRHGSGTHVIAATRVSNGPAPVKSSA